VAACETNRGVVVPEGGSGVGAIAQAVSAQATSFVCVVNAALDGAHFVRTAVRYAVSRSREKDNAQPEILAAVKSALCPRSVA
jgi:hypothetical protein